MSGLKKRKERFVWVRNKLNYAVLYDNEKGKVVAMLPIPEFKWIKVGNKAILVDVTTGKIVLEKKVR